MASRLSVACVLAAAAFAMNGCSSNTAASMDRKVRSDPTPELKTLSLRSIEEDNNRALTYDENWRMLNEDWNRFWLVDRPSRLARPRVPR